MFSFVINLIKEGLAKRETIHKGGVYMDVYEVIRGLIENENLPENYLMPPSRILAEKLTLSRSTLMKAYGLLVQNQFLDSRQGSGTRVMKRSTLSENLASSSTQEYPALSDGLYCRQIQ